MKGKTLELTQRITNVRNRITASNEYRSVLQAAGVLLPGLYQDASDEQKKAITKLHMDMQRAGVYASPARIGLNQIKAAEGKKIIERCVQSIKDILQGLPLPVPDAVYESLDKLLEALPSLG